MGPPGLAADEDEQGRAGERGARDRRHAAPIALPHRLVLPPAPEPEPEPTRDAADEDVSCADCAAARAAGAAPVRVGDPGHSRRLDRDGDGVACGN
ncbi:excalibur calcium-binding domain-containing protein [Streptomyces sp. NPDC057242]|uniref:excalibur calcium-binding domain-containing protein n=1 Tax=unclassified Streptomyces TaxID=2593676 RepID=UPI00363A5DA0